MTKQYVVTADHTAEGPVTVSFNKLSEAMEFVESVKTARNPRFSTGDAIGLYSKSATGETKLLCAWRDQQRQWVKIYRA